MCSFFVAVLVSFVVAAFGKCDASDLLPQIVNREVNVTFGITDATRRLLFGANGERGVVISNNDGEVKKYLMSQPLKFNDFELDAAFEPISDGSSKACFKVKRLNYGKASKIVLKTELPGESIAINCNGEFGEVVLHCHRAFVIGQSEQDNELKISRLVAGRREVWLTVVGVGFTVGDRVVDMGSYVLTKDGIRGYATFRQMDIVAKVHSDFAGIESLLDCDDHGFHNALTTLVCTVSRLRVLHCLGGNDKAKEILRNVSGRVLAIVDPSYQLFHECPLIKTLNSRIEEVCDQKDPATRGTFEVSVVARFLANLDHAYRQLMGCRRRSLSDRLPEYVYDFSFDEVVYYPRHHRVFVLKKDDFSFHLLKEKVANVEDFRRYLFTEPPYQHFKLEEYGSAMEYLDVVQFSVAGIHSEGRSDFAHLSMGIVFAEVAELMLHGGMDVDLAAMREAMVKCVCVYARMKDMRYRGIPRLELKERISLHSATGLCSTYLGRFKELWVKYSGDEKSSDTKKRSGNLDFDIDRMLREYASDV
ncbi:MAG: hypothetical protein LBB34_00805 [Holosporales bacterium]|jgi:hypothetical protein|nr:hypothetical protein [Holosporales bacterium]